MANEQNTVTIEDSRIIFRNFEGKEGQYNRAGDRNFAAILNSEVAGEMLKDGWNVKYLEPREEGEDPVAYLPVAVNFNVKPPSIVMITSSGRTRLSEETVSVLDWMDISNVDMIVRGFDWSSNGKSGTKAYLKTMFITVEEDELERKYAVRNADTE